tara:strand:+ start:4836 stop:5681 length:846 start_codon:yes stop_codon:yes gene_type:complete
MSLINHKQERPIIITGKAGTGKTTMAKGILPLALVLYANEMEIKSVFSIPIDMGIIIEDVHYKPKTKEILDVLRKYRGKIVLTSNTQKGIPSEIKNMVKIKRAGSVSHGREEILKLAPRSSEPFLIERDVFSLVMEYLRESDREKIVQLIKHNKPSDTQLISWLSENIHPNRLIFIDSVVKRRWPLSYFHEMISYAHGGKTFNRPKMPKRRAYSKMPSICRRLGLKSGDERILKQLLKDEDFQTYAKSKLNNGDYRLLGIGEKTKRKKKNPKLKKISLEEF